MDPFLIGLAVVAGIAAWTLLTIQLARKMFGWLVVTGAIVAILVIGLTPIGVDKYRDWAADKAEAQTVAVIQDAVEDFAAQLTERYGLTGDGAVQIDRILHYPDGVLFLYKNPVTGRPTISIRLARDDLRTPELRTVWLSSKFQQAEGERP